MPAKEKLCPICGKPQTAASKPFCSERCRDIDLNRWLSGSYAIPVRDDEDEDGSSSDRS
ncbi:MAG: DNA gyrase inhibitor YacG [Pseudomonadota bacterium]